MNKTTNMRNCSIETMNSIIKDLENKGRIFVNHPPKEDEIIGPFKVFLYKKISHVFLIYKDVKGHGKVVFLRASLNDDFNGVDINGTAAFAILQKYWKAPEANTKGDAPFSIGIPPYRNKKFVGKRTENCYGYDLNSAYPYGMLQELPDTSQPLPPGIVGEGEYSFSTSGTRRPVGEYSIYRFKSMPSPYKKFVETWYSRKANAKDEETKNRAKFILNASIGALQNHNCFIRAAIIYNFYQKIVDIRKKYKDHILSSNVDSIVSDIPIPEIEKDLGPEIGQWKLEHQGSYAIHPNGYSIQWNKEPPKFGAGKSQTWFGKDYDILVDPIPEPNTKFELDFKQRRIYEKEKEN